MSSAVVGDAEDSRDGAFARRPQRYSPPPPQAPPPPPHASAAPVAPPPASAFHPLPGSSSSGAAPVTVLPQTTKLSSKASLPGGGRASPSHSSTASDSAASPTLEGVGEGDGEGGRTGEKAFDWPAHSTYDERRQLLGTEEESSERPSSDEEEEKNPWSITREQMNYYTTQFFSMQPNPRGSIPGALAKEFFEKSRLPISELRKIWQLSDVTKDGCLSLEEFLTAMHLVVLRRNDIPLPEELPETLQPRTLRAKTATAAAADSRHNKDLYTRGQDNNSSLGGAGGGGEPLLLHDEADGAGNTSEDMLSHSRSRRKLGGGGTESGGDASSIASPGPKPVNFDFHRPDARMNPNLVHPVALRLSPESPVIPTSDDEDGGGRNGAASGVAGAAPMNVKQGRREVVYEQLWNQEDAASLAEESFSSMTLKGDTNTVTASLSTAAATVGSTARTLQKSNNTSDEECSTEIDGLQDLSPSPPSLPRDPSLPQHFSNALSHRLQQQKSPPPPPPRPGQRTHARSSSLDLNQFGKPPPAIPPRNNMGMAEGAANSLRAATSDRIVEERPLADPALVCATPPKDQRSLQIRIHQVKEKNSVIARTINELHQEVSDTLEERIALEFHLEQLKSFGD